VDESPDRENNAAESPIIAMLREANLNLVYISTRYLPQGVKFKSCREEKRSATWIEEIGHGLRKIPLPPCPLGASLD